MTEENNELQARLDDIKQFKAMKVELLSKRDDLKYKLEQDRERHRQNIQEIMEEKRQMHDKLRREMLQKIRITKMEMLNLNDEQLVGTTKLTVIQNAQLTAELEY